ncbi:MAG: DUF6527 family protein [Vicingaceae bacterium]
MEVRSVEFLPDDLEDNVLYVSFDYTTAVHLCMCGCKNQVVTPLDSNGWELKFKGSVTLYPSIGNWNFKCRSHYWIRNGKVIDCDSGKQFDSDKKEIQHSPESESWYISLLNKIKEFLSRKS